MFQSTLLREERPVTTISWFQPSEFQSTLLREERQARKWIARFQSLFYWKYLWDKIKLNFPSGYGLFQSLFYWKYLWDPLKFRVQCFQPAFQSLFYWKYLWDFLGTLTNIILPPVSLLVLLELSLRQQGLTDELTINTMFQSLFYWKYLWDS